MYQTKFPVIDLVATGENILRLRKLKGLSVRDLQRYFGFEEPQAIYKWQKGKSLPTVDNLYALGALLDVPMEEITVLKYSIITDCICFSAPGCIHQSYHATWILIFAPLQLGICCTLL